jgi:hypothetical protein
MDPLADHTATATTAVPYPASLVREMTTLHDALAYRLSRVTQPCPDCGPDLAADRCPAHLSDLDRIHSYYHRIRNTEKALDALPSAAPSPGASVPVAPAVADPATGEAEGIRDEAA